MILKKLIIILILSSVTTIFADDLIVDKNSRSQYQTDNFLRFDPFNLNNQINDRNGFLTPDTIDLSNKAVTLGSAFTQEARIFSDQRGVIYQDVIGYLPPGENILSSQWSPFIRTYDYGKSIVYGFGDGSNLYNIIVKDVISTPGWYHVAATFDGNNYKLFVNGSEVNNSSVAAGKSPINTPVKSIGTKFQGKIDEVRMWNVARTESEINNDMNKRLTGSETNLVAYYPMDVNGDYQLIDLSPNQNHGTIKNVDVMQRFSSNDCSAPDGTGSCPYPTINSALDDAQPGDRVLIKGGRYSEYLKIIELNDVKIEGYPDENVIIDGTIPLNTEWVPYNHNGHNIYKTVIDFDSLSYRYGIRTDSVYSVFVNERYMMMSMPVNYKNPTDSINGDPKNVDPGTIYSLKIKSPLQHSDQGYQPGELANLDTLEEWSFDPGTGTLYLYPSGGFIPDKNNVRIRPRIRLVDIVESDRLEFRNLHFFSGTFKANYADFLTVENSKFSFSSDMKASGSSNGTEGGEYSWWTNLVFENINHGSPLNHSRNMFPTMENILFRNTGWFHYNFSWPPIVGRNYRSTGSDRTHGGDIWRYITIRDSNGAGLFAGMRSLTEYIRIENVFGVGDNASIQRNASSADSSTTRYVWVINGPDWNGIRLNSACGGTYADLHHIVSTGQRRGFRLKGDYHEAYHLLAYENATWDLYMSTDKYCGPDGSGPKVPGNTNSSLKNTAVDFAVLCSAIDCGTDSYVLDPNPANLDTSGIYYAQAHVEKKPYYSVGPEIENPWSKYKAYSDEQLLEKFSIGPLKNKIQNYDFRPKKGSTFIDGGVVIPGINDGQDKAFNHAPLYPGQNRKYVGQAPDIGPYEYGDSVYWIPGYRYPHPSVPIPSDGATDISLEYGIAWNYPYKKDYTNVTATVTISGPGVNRTETFQYPNNVLFETFELGGTYHWSVTVDGVSGPTWKFTVIDKALPLNDLSIDPTITKIQPKINDSNLVVSNSRMAFMRFDFPSSINSSYKINLNLIPNKIHALDSGVILYRYDYKGWNESFGSKNIGLIDKSLLTPIDTLYSLTADSTISKDLTAFIDTTGEHSFALKTMNTSDSLSFYSAETVLETSAPTRMQELPYIPDKDAWPSLSFLKDSLSVEYDIPLEKEWNLISVPFTGVKTHPKQIFRSLIRKGLLEYVSSPSGYFKPKDPY
ncbi:uncharacterized protein METZ01_LOCUS100122, partial [marine metagenome]